MNGFTEKDRLYADAAALAGELIITSGGEIFRTEDTIRHILRKTDCMFETIAYNTGIFICLRKEKVETAYTVLIRIHDHSTDLEKICHVNEISRKLETGEISIEKAYEDLKKLRNLDGTCGGIKWLSYIGVAFFFAMLLGGSVKDCVFAGIAGCAAEMMILILERFRMENFISNAAGAFVVGIIITCLQSLKISDLNISVIVASAIMPIVPGVTFTIAVRDIFYGDYASGTSRMMEALITAIAIATGMGSGIALGRLMI